MMESNKKSQRATISFLNSGTYAKILQESRYSILSKSTTKSVTTGIIFATADKIMMALDCELEFRKY